MPFYTNFARMSRIKLYFILFFTLFTFPTIVGQNIVQCEDTCTHIHGIDISHYQGNVFWEIIGDNTNMAYVYLKASEGGDRIDEKFEHNIQLAHQYGLKVGAYHFFRPRTDLNKQLVNFMAQCRPKEQDLVPMIDIETKGGLSTEEFCDSLLKFIKLVERPIDKSRYSTHLRISTTKTSSGKSTATHSWWHNIHSANQCWPMDATSPCGNTRVKDASTASTAMWTRADLCAIMDCAKLNSDINA